MQEGLAVFMRNSKIKGKYDAEVQQTAGYRTIPWPAGQGGKVVYGRIQGKRTNKSGNRRKIQVKKQQNAN